MGLDPQVEKFAEHLLSLPEDEREAAGKSLNQLLVAQLPDDEVGGKPPIRKLGEYLDTPVKRPPILVEPGLVAVGAISALVSRGGKGKTAVSLNRLLRWSMGKPLFDELPTLMKPENPLRVLIIENEGNGGHFQKVLQTIIDGSDFTKEEIDLARDNVHVWGDGGWSGLKIDRAEDLDLVQRGTAETEADIVFVEPFRGLWQGDENSATDMQVVVDSMSQVANTHDCAVMLTHHENKSGGGEGLNFDPMNAFRGSTVLEAAAAVMERWLPVSAGRQRELSCAKNRFDEAYTPVRMEFERERWGYRYVTENEGRRAVKAVLLQFEGQWLTVKDVAADLEETEQRTRKLLNELVDDESNCEKQSMGGGQMGYRITGRNGDRDPGDGTIAI